MERVESPPSQERVRGPSVVPLRSGRLFFPPWDRLGLELPMLAEAKQRDGLDAG